MGEQDFRVEHDSMGELKVPTEALWGAQTQRAVQNFPISGLAMPRAFIRATSATRASNQAASSRSVRRSTSSDEPIFTTIRRAAFRRAAPSVPAGPAPAWGVLALTSAPAWPGGPRV